MSAITNQSVNTQPQSFVDRLFAAITGWFSKPPLPSISRPTPDVCLSRVVVRVFDEPYGVNSRH